MSTPPLTVFRSTVPETSASEMPPFTVFSDSRHLCGGRYCWREWQSCRSLQRRQLTVAEML
jgi:hypothetical protein